MIILTITGIYSQQVRGECRLSHRCQCNSAITGIDVRTSFKNLENVRCNSFELVFTKSIDNGVMFYEVEYYYDQDIVGTPNRVSKTKRFSRARGGEAFDGLDNNQTVHFRIRAGNDAEYDESSWTGWNDGTTSAGNPPETPLNFTINQITPLTARLSFTPAPGSLTHGYEIYHKVESELSGDNGLFRKIMEIDNSSATVEVSTGEGLIDSFAIRAFNDDPNCGRAFLLIRKRFILPATTGQLMHLKT